MCNWSGDVQTHTNASLTVDEQWNISISRQGMFVGCMSALFGSGVQ